MTRRVRVDICVIGAGSGGLSVAAGASRMGAETVLVEQGKMGGDCLNYGCVPSKSMLAAAHAAERVRASGRFGVDTPEPDIDFAGVHRHVHEVIAGIAPHDSVERFEGLGVRVIQAHARFVAADAIEAGDVTVEARRFVVATGSRPMAPPIPGLDGVPFLTNETVFDATRAPEHLIVIGGGPIGAELSQAHRRLGARVTMLEMFTMLGNDDPELVAVVRDRLSAEGVDIHEGAKVVRVEARGNGVAVTVDSQGAERRIEGSHLLVAAGRSPTSTISASRPPASPMARPESRSTRGCAPPTSACSPSATSPGRTRSRTWPATTLGSSSATRCSGCPRRSITGRCRGSPSPIPSSRRSA